MKTVARMLVVTAAFVLGVQTFNLPAPPTPIPDFNLPAPPTPIPDIHMK